MKKMLFILTMCLVNVVARAELPRNYLPMMDRFVMQNKICPLADTRCTATRQAYDALTSNGYCLFNPDRPSNVQSWSDCPKPAEDFMQLQRSDCSDIDPQSNVLSNASETVLNRVDQAGKQCSAVCGLPSGMGINSPFDQCQKLVDKAVLINAQETARRAQLEAQMKQQQEAKEKQEKFQAQAAELKAAREKADAEMVRGYQRMSVDDFVLDERTMPQGKKVLINGYFEASGDMEYLRKLSSRMVASQKSEIPLLSDGASRETRSYLMHLHQICDQQYGAICNVTVIGKVEACTVTFFSAEKKTTCIAIDSVMSGP